jgi:hypothetical protein
MYTPVVFAGVLMLLATSSYASLSYHVDCSKGLGMAHGTAAAPFRTLQQAQYAIRAFRTAATANEPSAPPPAAVVNIKGLCELKSPLTLSAEDSHVRYIGSAAILSGGTEIKIPSTFGSTMPVEVDLKTYNFTAVNLGKLSGRGYSGGSACILVDNFEPSAAELFFRPAGASSAAGARAYGPAQEGTMWVARFPNRAAGGLPAASDWAGITSVENLTLTIDAFQSMLPAWQTELGAGGEAFLHGLWKWNWADSHRPLLGINGSRIAVGADDINRDVNPIRPHKTATQGGYVYAYGLRSLLDAPGEYHINPKTAKLSFIPPEGASSGSGSYSISRLDSVVIAKGVSDVSFENLEIRYSRGAGVVVGDSTNFILKGCTVSNHGMMGLNVTGGRGCGVHWTRSRVCAWGGGVSNTSGHPASRSLVSKATPQLPANTAKGHRTRTPHGHCVDNQHPYRYPIDRYVVCLKS